MFSKVLGKEVFFINVSPEQMGGALRAAGFPEWQMGGLIEDYARYARAEAATVYTTVNDITGGNALSFEQFANDYKAVFA